MIWYLQSKFLNQFLTVVISKSIMSRLYWVKERRWGGGSETLKYYLLCRRLCRRMNHVLISAEHPGGWIWESVISWSAERARRGCLSAGPTGCFDVGHSAGGSVAVVGGGRHWAHWLIAHQTRNCIVFFRNIICSRLLRLSVPAGLLFWFICRSSCKTEDVLLLPCCFSPNRIMIFIVTYWHHHKAS